MRVHILRLEREHALRGFNRRPDLAVQGLELAEVVPAGDEIRPPPQQLLGDAPALGVVALVQPRLRLLVEDRDL